MAIRNKKVVVSTLIIVGEGACEKAFLGYLKQLFSNNIKLMMPERTINRALIMLLQAMTREA